MSEKEEAKGRSQCQSQDGALELGSEWEGVDERQEVILLTVQMHLVLFARSNAAILSVVELQSAYKENFF